MRKSIVLSLALFIILFSVGCNEQIKTAEESSLSSNETAESSATEVAVDSETVLTSSPELSVIVGEERIEALKGTNSWYYQKEDGSYTGFTADALHPLQSKEYMTALNLSSAVINDHQSITAQLQWDVAPIEVSVRCWNEEYWDQMDAVSEEINVDIAETEASLGSSQCYSIQLKDGNYIYEVVAKWQVAEKYNGDAYYSFYTTKMDTKS